LNCRSVAKHCKFDARGTVVPNTATASALAVEIKMATFTGAERARCVFWSEETKSDALVQRKFRTQYRKEHPGGLQFTRGTRILLSPNVLCAMPSHPVSHVFLTLQWDSLLKESFVRSPRKSPRRASRETGIRNVILCGECYENVYT
jgi:hypothetical protein